MMGEESQRREDAAKEKETAAKKKEQARLQMEQLEEVGYGDNFTSLEGTGPPPCNDRESERVALRLEFCFPVFSRYDGHCGVWLRTWWASSRSRRRCLRPPAHRYGKPTHHHPPTHPAATFWSGD
jgi:hypothetical protein